MRGGLRTLPDFAHTRGLRIQEALSFSTGRSLEDPISHVVGMLPDGQETLFLKPGKEAFRKKNPRPHDMTPVVPHYKGAQFRDVWSALARASAADAEAFRGLAVLIYRSAYHLDHDVECGRHVRYSPSGAVSECIEEVDRRLRPFLPTGGAWSLLFFLDLLGWNEDVKYHSENAQPTFNGQYPFKAGRVNTLLTCIRVPFEISRFARHASENIATPDAVDFNHMIAVMQQFANSRGTCVPTQNQLLRWFAPYLRE